MDTDVKNDTRVHGPWTVDTGIILNTRVHGPWTRPWTRVVCTELKKVMPA